MPSRSHSVVATSSAFVMTVSRRSRSSCAKARVVVPLLIAIVAPSWTRPAASRPIARFAASAGSPVTGRAADSRMVAPPYVRMTRPSWARRWRSRRTVDGVTPSSSATPAMLDPPSPRSRWTRCSRRSASRMRVSCARTARRVNICARIAHSRRIRAQLLHHGRSRTTIRADAVPDGHDPRSTRAQVGARVPRARRRQPVSRSPTGHRDIDLLVVGDVNPDILVAGSDPRPVFGQAERAVDSIGVMIGGSSTIVACAAARLGLNVALVGAVGDDALGRLMLEAVAARGVAVPGCRVVAGVPTGASVILAADGDRAILTAAGAIGELRASDVPAGLLARARHVHVGSFFLQPRLASGLPALFDGAHAHGATTSLDPNFDPSGMWDDGFAAAAAGADLLL